MSQLILAHLKRFVVKEDSTEGDYRMSNSIVGIENRLGSKDELEKLRREQMEVMDKFSSFYEKQRDKDVRDELFCADALVQKIKSCWGRVIAAETPPHSGNSQGIGSSRALGIGT